MPRPRSLDHDRIATAALAVIDRAGLDQLSMRTVAAELGVGTMSLYRYVADRREVEALVVDRVLASLDLTVTQSAEWTDQVADVLGRVRDAVRAHPAVVPLFLSHRHTNVQVMRCGEVLLRILAGAGLTGADRVVAFRTLISYLVGALSSDHLGPLSGAGTAALARLPRDDFPYLADTAGTARAIGPDDEFRGGLDVVLAGLRHRLGTPD
ncbi:TetR family transcriptional regulator [Micromonospora sp. WMMC415]|nr:TetR family transcriptional regulator [Micromonospora sp. WMMC415]